MFTIMDDGIALQAELDMPEKAEGKMPVAVLMHGFTGYKEEWHILAVSKALTEAGYAVLRADMFGHGKSGGEFRNHTLFKWMGNAMTLIDYARNLDFASEIYICGHSQGGLTAMLAAALKRDQISGMIALSPAWMIPELARKGNLLGLDFDPVHIPDELPAWNNNVLDGNYVRAAQTIHVEEYIDRYDGPVLIVHGDNDGAVPVEYGIKAAERYQNSKLVVIPGDDHCYAFHLDQVVKAVKDWAVEQKKARAGA
ncbi:MAG: alpha/beta fold hydrolase [Clostridia bacterium]|jgi:hypothetical protein|nr:alpha/beta fold hydrolase [Clostridia bacterium]